MCDFAIYFFKNLSLFYSIISLFMCQGNIIITVTKVFDEKELYLVNKAKSASSIRMRAGDFSDICNVYNIWIENGYFCYNFTIT